MKTQDFFFDLPPERIAQFPSKERNESRLMLLDRRSGRFYHHTTPDLPRLLEAGSLIIGNKSRVRKARLAGVDEQSGKTLEFLLIPEGALWKALVKQSRSLPIGAYFCFPGGKRASIVKKESPFCYLDFDTAPDEAWFERYGQVPLPPYIKRPAGSEDAGRYQTVYAEETGSLAAPTAGLHITRELLAALHDKKIETAFITLHVGLGTFLPVRTENIEDHRMHHESFFIDEETAAQIERAKREKRPVVAIGTTSLRALESAWQAKEGKLSRGWQTTNLFIYGDYTFNVVDTLFTNFHTPASTLLMLVSSFCGAESGAESGRTMILSAYQKAIESGYRFFSYGDAMLLR